MEAANDAASTVENIKTHKSIEQSGKHFKSNTEKKEKHKFYFLEFTCLNVDFLRNQSEKRQTSR